MKSVGDLIYKALKIARRQNFEASEVSLDDGRFLVVVLPLSDEEEPSEFDRPWKSAFLRWLSHGLTIQQAADLSGISRKHAYNSRGVDASFREAWDRVRTTCNRRKEKSA